MTPGRATCPYLRGLVGTVVTCRLGVAGRTRVVDVVVTTVDPGSYATRFALRHGKRH